LKKDESRSFRVSFNPLDTGNLSAIVTFTCNGKTNPTMDLKGIGAYTSFVTDKNLLSFVFEFNETATQTKVINLNNIANIPSSCVLSIEGAYVSVFSIESPGTSINFDPMNEKPVSIKCDMTGKDLANAELSIKNGVTSEITTIPLEAVRKPNSVQDISNSRISIMPNPVSDNFEIHVPNEFIDNSIITIYDIFGNKLLTHRIGLEFTKLNMVNFSDGVYFLVLTSDSSRYYSKFIKKK
jgi:hypothetical protein